MNRKRNKKILIILSSSLVAIIVAATLFLRIHKENNNDIFIHISFDDTIILFEDLTINESTYQSIFENDFLSYLKWLHEKYGAVFSFYCYYKNANFDLSQATDKFASEFNSNSDWLKFGYHGTNSEEKLEDLSALDAVVKYQNVMTELIRITGGTEAIDTVPRLHYFSGNESAMIAIANTEYGPKGFLTADDDRASYYLQDHENMYINMNDYMKDSNGIYFISTDLRLENTSNPYISLMKIAKDEKQNKCIEVFTHEWQIGRLMKLKLLITCFFSYKQGYSWDYPMYRYAQ